MDRTELLAPAKDLERGLIAIQCGADAVYIGPPRFGARENASNRLEDIAALVQYAHKYWVKVYATINTLLRDDEIPLAMKLIWRLYEIGIDGLIIQDVGLLECDLPPLPFIASTQMHNHTPEKVAFLEQIGFQRVILARELSLDQIKAIRRTAPRIELECFVHGALCVGYSGQCYLSYALGGRSGNRGQCAQPCRKSYTLVDAHGRVLVSRRYLLSLRDLNLSDHLIELIQSGVRSFKIEGRLKDKAYVANVVAYYRNRLDQALAETGFQRSSSGISRIDFTPDPDMTFNRGYTAYFLNNKNQQLGSMETPKMVGEFIGKILSVNQKGIAIDTQIAMHPGDGICFFNRDQQLQGTNINTVSDRWIVPDKWDGLEKGVLIYRNHDHEFLNRVDKSRKDRRIAVNFILREIPGGLSLLVVDEDGVQAESLYQSPMEPAEKPEQAIATIRKQLQKTGGSIFICQTVKIEVIKTIFLPIAALNTLRREVLEKLTAARETKHLPPKRYIIRNEVPYTEKELTYQGNVLNRHAEAFYKRHGVKKIEPAAESGLDMKGRKLMATRYCLKHPLGLCPKDGNSTPLVEPLFLIDEEGRRLELRFDCERCEMEIVM